MKLFCTTIDKYNVILISLLSIEAESSFSLAYFHWHGISLLEIELNVVLLQYIKSVLPLSILSYSFYLPNTKYQISS